MIIKDYLHLYLGCPIAIPSVADIEDWDGYTLHEINTDGMCAVLHNEFGITFHEVEDIKPLLRPLSDMSVEEKLEIKVPIAEICLEFMSKEWAPKQVVFLLSKGFDLFGLIDAGLALDKTKLE